MATYQEVVRRVNGYTHRLAVQLQGQDVASNVSRLKWEYSIYFDGRAQDGGWTQLQNVNFNWQVGSYTGNNHPNFDFRANRTFVVARGDLAFTHDAAGNLSLPLRFIASALPGSVQFKAIDSGFEYMALPNIPRASTMTVTPASIYPGDAIAIHFERANAGFVHDVAWAASNGGPSGTIATDVATDVSWTPPNPEDLLGGSKRRSITITAQTKSGGAPIGAVISKDIVLTDYPDDAQVGVGTPYDIRFKRAERSGTNIVAKETIPILTGNFTDTLTASGSCTFTVSDKMYSTDLDEAVVLADTYDGSQWNPIKHIFVLTRTEDDKADITGTTTYTGQSYVDYLLSKAVPPDDFDWPPTAAGNIIAQYFDQAKGRGWGPLVFRRFGTNSGEGTPWQNTSDIAVTGHPPLSQVLEGFVSDVLVEYDSYYDATVQQAILDIHNPGYGLDWTTSAASPIVNLATAALFKVADRAPVRKDFSNKLTRVQVVGDEGRITRENGGAVNQMFGHLEGTVAASGVKDLGTLQGLGDATLQTNSTGTIERTYSYDLSSSSTPTTIYPYRTFVVGDYILVPGDGSPIRQRVSQIAISKDADTITATITVGDLIPSGAAATARKLAQTGGNAIAGGTLTAPAQLSASIPSAPTNVVATPDGYWTQQGQPAAGVALTWNPITTSLAGTSLSVNAYEVWTRQEAGSPWGLVGLADAPEYTIAPLDINSSLDIRVRGRSAAGIYGDFSDPINVTTPPPDETLIAPSAPTVTSDAIGTVKITWDGKLVGNVGAPLWFDHVIAEIAPTSTGAWSPAGTQLTTAGDIVVPNVGAGTWYFRLVGYDKLNQRGAAGTPVSTVVEVAIGDDRIPKAPTGLDVTSTGYWNGGIGESSVTATWNAVTQATDNSTIGITRYELWGKLSTEQNYRSMGTTEATTITVAPVGPIGSTWNFKVRAQAENDNVSDLGSQDDVVIVGPVVNLLPPTRPSVNSASGLLLVSWDGYLLQAGNPDNSDDDVNVDAPVYLTTVDIQVSVNNGVNWQTVGFLTKGTRVQSVGGLGVGTSVKVRLIGHDSLNQASSASPVATITIAGVGGADIIAGTITGDKIAVGAITTNNISPTFGKDLDISANGTVSIISGQAASAQTAASNASSSVAALRTRYDFTPTEAVISQPGSPFQVAISNTQMEFRESGVARAYLNAGVFNAPRMASGQLVLKYHVIENDQTNGTVIRRLSQ